MQYSPKLKKAMEEIKEILKKNDIAAFVVLHTPGFCEFVNHLNTSYSCAKINPDGELRFRIKTAEVGKEKAKEMANGTGNLFTHFSSIVGQYAMMYIEGLDLLKTKFHIDGTPGDMTSHTEQNN